MSIKYAPRVPRRLRNAVNDVCRLCDMPEADVLRYSFEAVVLTAPQRLSSKTLLGSADALDHMVTIRTSRRIHSLVNVIWQDHRQDYPEILQADILRALIETILPDALKYGMAHVLSIREKALWDLSENT